jgi:hypothetical protein
VAATDPELRVELGGGSGGSPNDPRSIGWEISALLVLPASSASGLPAVVTAALTASATASNYGVHEWQWLGPFSDLNATAFDVVSLPDVEQVWIGPHFVLTLHCFCTDFV